MLPDKLGVFILLIKVLPLSDRLLRSEEKEKKNNIYDFNQEILK